VRGVFVTENLTLADNTNLVNVLGANNHFLNAWN
jgi:hypothetical protein